MKKAPTGGWGGDKGQVKFISAIADTGPGLDPAEAARLFDRFARGRPERAGGLGLGLSVVRGFAEAHTGRVTYALNHPSEKILV